MKPDLSSQGDFIHSDVEIAAASAHIRRLTRLAYLGAVVALVVIFAFAFQFHGKPSNDPQHWGQLGDYIGGLLNPTFSFLALIALLATLGLQVRELKISARELKNSADALASQNETLRLQTFEQTFFQLLRLHNEIVLSLRANQGTLQGRACMRYFLNELEGTLINHQATADIDHFQKFYDSFYASYQESLGHYFRLLYNIVKLVKHTQGIDRRFYTNLVRAQLSSAELKLIFYNCLTRWGEEKFKPLVEEFSLLKNVPEQSVPSHVLYTRYKKSAFGDDYPGVWKESQ